MALAYKTGCGVTKTSSTAATTTGAMTLGSTGAATGETIIVAVGTVNTTSNAPTDNATPSTNIYVQIATAVVNTEKITFWGCLSSKSAVTTVTATFTSSRYGVAVSVYQGVKSFSATNTKTATGGTTPATLTLSTALGSGNWTLMGGANKGTATWTANGAPSNLRDNIAGAGTTTPGACIVDSTTTTAAAATTSTAWAVTGVELFSFYTQALTAGMSTFAGTVPKQTTKVLAGGMSTFGGSLVKQAIKVLTAGMSTFAGALVASHVFIKNLTASMSTFAGSLTKLTSHVLTGSMSTFSGSLAETFTVSQIFTAAMSTFSAIVVGVKQSGPVTSVINFFRRHHHSGRKLWP